MSAVTKTAETSKMDLIKKMKVGRKKQQKKHALISDIAKQNLSYCRYYKTEKKKSNGIPHRCRTKQQKNSGDLHNCGNTTEANYTTPNNLSKKKQKVKKEN